MESKPQSSQISAPTLTKSINRWLWLFHLPIQVMPVCVCGFSFLGGTHGCLSFLVHQVAQLLHALGTVYGTKRKVARTEMRAKHKDFLKQKEQQEEEKQKRLKEEKKKLYRIMGQKEGKKLKSSLKGAAKDD